MLLAVVALLAAAVAPPGAGASAARSHYLSLARKGVSRAHSHWWNRRQHWYNDRLHDHRRFRLATIWSIVPLFEAVDGVAIGSPGSRTKGAVKSFARQAERYWDRAMHAYGPYRGDRGREQVWFDDNGWWGLGFVDAYRATHKRRYLGDAARASKFIAAHGWDRKHGGMWWTSWHRKHSLEAMAAGTALAAELYQYTGRSKYRRAARTYIRWADKHAWRSGAGLYANGQTGVLSYVQGAMIGAHLALCRKGDKDACAKAEQLAAAAYRHWNGGSPDKSPQFDTILFRYVIQLAGHDRNATWWDWAHRVAKQAERKARTKGGLYLRFWDGSRPNSHGDGAGRFKQGMVQTHAATVALFAWLGAVERPAVASGVPR